MATGIGTVTINFGIHPGNYEAQVAVTDQAGIAAGDHAEAFIMGDDAVGDHTASDHRWFAQMVGLTCGEPVADDGFIVYARSAERLQGLWKLRFVWATPP